MIDNYIEHMMLQGTPHEAESDNLSDHLSRNYPDWAFVLADEGKRKPETGEQLFFDL